MFKAYINGVGNISPQNTFDSEVFLEEPIAHSGNFLYCHEPIYQHYIQSALLRRMSRIIRMSITAANRAMQEAGLEQADAILTGTAMGCLQDTEKFLSALIENGEDMLTPTAFVQSTHNTIGGQIALLRQNTCYNMTYTQRGFSFESALLDALLRIAEKESHCALLGGIDELIKTNEVFFQELDCVKMPAMPSLELLEQHRSILNGEVVAQSTGAAVGEGATFFVLLPTPQPDSYCRIDGVKMSYKPKDFSLLQAEINQFLAELDWAVADVDAIILGNNGDSRFDGYYHQLQQGLFAEKQVVFFKHLCGEYPTATAFATWLGAKIIKTQQIPEAARGNNRGISVIRKVLIYNNFQGVNHSLIALSKC